MRRPRQSMSIAALACLLAACATQPTTPRPMADPAPVHPELAGVFHQFGGVPGLTALMDELMDILVADQRTHRQFVDADQARIKRQLVEQFCAILDGGCSYSGRDMREAHRGLGIDQARFNALVEDLQLAMRHRGIPQRAQDRLLAVLAPMHREIISR